MDSSNLTKLYYSIGEVAEMFSVNTSLLRFWEGEFPQLKPRKNRRGTRQYRVKDVEIIGRIYNLVKVQGFTIDGAKKQMAESKNSDHSIKDTDTGSLTKKLNSIRDRLLKIRSGLD